jgi:hypothetical protein
VERYSGKAWKGFNGGAQFSKERRLRAAWIDYLRIVQAADRSEYDQVEQNAWEQLQRRLRRNDELRDTAAQPAAPAQV